jgi:hypothetical protein
MRALARTGFSLWLATATASAAVVAPGDPAPGGIGYRWTITMTDTDSATAIRHVGALSHNDPINFATAPLTGWTHTSDWVALDLTAPALLTVTLSRKAGVPNGANTAGADLFPAFSLYAGWDNDDGDDHIYNNSGLFAWAEDLTAFLGAQHNGAAVGTNTPGLGLTTVSQTFSLPAGLYSIALGGNPPDSIGSGRQGYELTLTTVAVPEAGALTLCGFAAAGAAGAGAAAFRRRRRNLRNEV